MAPKIIISNDGTSTNSHDYTASQSIMQSINFKRVTGFINAVHNYSVDLNFELSSSFVSQFSNDFGTQITLALTKAYSKSTEFGAIEPTSLITEELKHFHIKQKIDIPVCTKYEVRSFLAINENQPIEYTIYSKMTATRNGGRLETSGFVELIKDFEYVEDYDNYTAIVKTSGNIMVTFGIETLVEGNGTKITDCIA